MRPHVLGIDDAPFVKGGDDPVPIVGVMMEGAELVEGISIGAFPIDGDGATDYLQKWIFDMRWRSSLQAIVLGGITIAGLGIVDLVALSDVTGIPVLAVTRRDTKESDLDRALISAGFPERLPVVHRTPLARKLPNGLYLASAGIDERKAEKIARATISKSMYPEPLRIAHLIGAALVYGQSRGRV